MIQPLPVTHEDIVAFEESTGFRGIGERMVRAGIWKFKEESCRKTVMAPHPSTVSSQQEKGTPQVNSRA